MIWDGPEVSALKAAVANVEEAVSVAGVVDEDVLAVVPEGLRGIGGNIGEPSYLGQSGQHYKELDGLRSYSHNALYHQFLEASVRVHHSNIMCHGGIETVDRDGLPVADV